MVIFTLCSFHLNKNVSSVGGEGGESKLAKCQNWYLFKPSGRFTDGLLVSAFFVFLKYLSLILLIYGKFWRKVFIKLFWPCQAEWWDSGIRYWRLKHLSHYLISFSCSITELLKYKVNTNYPEILFKKQILIQLV